jgi:hypothetical protein
MPIVQKMLKNAMNRACGANSALKLKCSVASLLVMTACAGGADETTTIDDTSPLESTPEQAAPGGAAADPAQEYGEIFEGQYVPQTYDDVVARFHAAFKAELSESEVRTVTESLRQAGEDNRLSVRGRVLVDDDAFLNVDSPLGGVVRDVEKGRTLSGSVPHPIYDVTSTVYARMDPANPADFQFKKPYFGINQKLRVVVPNNTVRDIMQAAINKLTAAADDCISSTSMDVMLKSAWDALGQSQANYAPVFVSHGAQATVCPDSSSSGTVHGCAAFPRAYSIAIGTNLFQHRMVVGQYVGLNSSTVTSSTDADSVGTATHELMHAMGFGHTYVQDSDGDLDVDATDVTTDASLYLTIPGTVGRVAPTSIMRGRGYNSTCEGTTTTCTRVNDLSNDDKISFDTLYSAQPGSTCSPVVWETTCDQACVRVSNVSIANHCCWCGGGTTPRHFERSTFNASTYLCVE